MKKIIRSVLIGGLLIIAMIFAIVLPRRELRVIAQATGIALDSQNGEVMATFELAVPAVDQPFGKERQIVSASGRTLEECLINARLSLGKELYVDDISVLIIQEKNKEVLLREVSEYYSKFDQDHMELPLFIAKNQNSSTIFNGKGKILSIEIAESARLTGRRMTVRDYFNGSKDYVYIQGDGAYEIIS